MSPVACSFFCNALSSLSLPRLSLAPGETSSSLIISVICTKVWSSLCLSSSNSAADRASSPWHTGNTEPQLVKPKTVGAVELIITASRVSLEDKPSERGGRDCKESRGSGGDAKCS